jgi:hemoglobin
MHVLKSTKNEANPGAAAGLTEASLRDVVSAFYARVRVDPALGPIFNGAVHDWDAHLTKLTAFWCTMALGAGTYKGNPMTVHRAHREALSPALFTRWLSLWGETTSERLPEPAARFLQMKAGRMAENLQAGLFGAAP